MYMHVVLVLLLCGFARGAYETSPAARLDREAKERNNALFAAAALAQNASKPVGCDSRTLMLDVTESEHVCAAYKGDEERQLYDAFMASFVATSTRIVLHSPDAAVQERFLAQSKALLERKRSGMPFDVAPESEHSSDAGATNISALSDPTYLPRHAEILALFPWLTGTSELTETALFPEQWWRFMTEQSMPRFEIWNREYIARLGAYISRRTAEMHGVPVLLELGAGHGVLASHLANFTDHYIAVDHHPPENAVFAVDAMDNDDALQRYEPQIVICSWMSFRRDWTRSIRRTSSVQEYILIGETDYGVSGTYAETWAREAWGSEWQKFHLDDLSVWQISCSSGPLVRFATETVSFRRRPEREEEGHRSVTRPQRKGRYKVIYSFAASDRPTLPLWSATAAPPLDQSARGYRCRARRHGRRRVLGGWDAASHPPGTTLSPARGRRWTARSA